MVGHQIVLVAFVALTALGLSESQNISEPWNELRLDAAVTPAQRALMVKEAMRHAWNSYSLFAFGQDELRPLSQEGRDWMGLGATLIDSLDTLYLMGLDEEFANATDWVRLHLDFDVNRSVSMFETTIRILGGLLSAYDLSGEPAFLEKAEDLGDRLLRSWKSSIPDGIVNLQTGNSSNPNWTGGTSILAEVGSVQMEMVYLSVLLNQTRFAEKALGTYHELAHMPGRVDGMFPVHLSNVFLASRVSLGAMGDSFYEYLLKTAFLLTPRSGPADKDGMRWGDVDGGSGARYASMYRDAMTPVKEKLFYFSEPNNFFYISEFEDGHTIASMDHLVCFAGGMLGLESKLMQNDASLAAAEDLARTCVEMYSRQATGLSPESIDFNATNDFHIPESRFYNIQRPETAESLFYLWRLTGKPIYREWGWQIFRAFERHSRVATGYCGVRDVTMVPSRPDDLQQSFFLAETLKYLFLLFSEADVVPLDKFVFNTEAHPFPRLTVEQAAFVESIIQTLPPMPTLAL